MNIFILFYKVIENYSSKSDEEKKTRKFAIVSSFFSFLEQYLERKKSNFFQKNQHKIYFYVVLIEYLCVVNITTTTNIKKNIRRNKIKFQIFVCFVLDFSFHVSLSLYIYLSLFAFEISAEKKIKTENNLDTVSKFNAFKLAFINRKKSLHSVDCLCMRYSIEKALTLINTARHFKYLF